LKLLNDGKGNFVTPAPLRGSYGVAAAATRYTRPVAGNAWRSAARACVWPNPAFRGSGGARENHFPALFHYFNLERYLVSIVKAPLVGIFACFGRMVAIPRSFESSPLRGAEWRYGVGPHRAGPVAAAPRRPILGGAGESFPRFFPFIQF